MQVAADMEELSDEALSEVSGQGFVSIDQQTNPFNPNLTYTRINLGLDIETQLNIDRLDLARFPRIDEQTGLPEEQPSDILIDNFALGGIFNREFFEANPSLPMPVRADGSAFQNGEIIPFEILDPFFEFAFDESSGQREVVGVRLGFGGAQGFLSGDIQSLTGNIEVDIGGDVSNLVDALDAANVTGGTAGLLRTFEFLIGGVDLTTNAELVFNTGNGALTGEIDRARATAIGVPNGDPLVLDLGFFGDIEIGSDQCSLIGLNVCFPLSQFRSLPIGQRDSSGQIVAPASGLFLSFQTQAVPFLKDVNGSLNDPGNFINTVPGAFLNIPSGGLNVDFVSAISGVPRVRTEYIDRGLGLF